MITRLESEYLKADLSAVESLIRDMGEKPSLTRMSLESRRNALVESIANAESSSRVLASIALFFGGKPVIGTRGIESTFGSKAISAFQDVITKVDASKKSKPLKSKGRVRGQQKSMMHITHIVHGSFGFQFEEIETVDPLFNSSLKESVDTTAKLLSSFDVAGDEAFGSAIEDINKRVLNSISTFFELVENNEATLRFVSDQIDKKFDKEAIERAADRARITSIEENEETFFGQLDGVLPNGGSFEYKVPGNVIRGKVDRELSTEQIKNDIQPWENTDSEATMRVKRFTKQGVIYHTAYFLLKIEKRSI